MAAKLVYNIVLFFVAQGVLITAVYPFLLSSSYPLVAFLGLILLTLNLVVLCRMAKKLTA
jgi:hypothetical protein